MKLLPAITIANSLHWSFGRLVSLHILIHIIIDDTWNRYSQMICSWYIGFILYNPICLLSSVSLDTMLHMIWCIEPYWTSSSSWGTRDSRVSTRLRCPRRYNNSWSWKWWWCRHPIHWSRRTRFVYRLLWRKQGTQEEGETTTTTVGITRGVSVWLCPMWEWIKCSWWQGYKHEMWRSMW